MSGPALALVARPDERLTPLERLEVLCDPGSLQLVRTAVRSQRMGERARDGDGVLGGTGMVDGRAVACFAQDASFAGGSLGEAHADTVVRVLEMAGRGRMPCVGFVESAGARMQEGVAALAGYGRIFRAHTALSGQVPQISIVCGASAGGGSYAPALTDIVVMTRRASMFLTGPGVVQEVTGEDVDAATLGGPRVHARNGVCHLVADTEVDAALLARDLLDHLPQHAGVAAQRWPSVDPAAGAPDAVVPAEQRRVYDVRHVIARLVDGGRQVELGERWARNVVCALARIDGRAVGVVANQPRHLGGVLDAESASKAARFVRTCDAFGLPLVVLVDTPGFLPGTAQERAGVIRHGAKLVHAFAAATVPRITVVLRKAFGGAFIAMNSKDLGADYVFAWPQAQIGVMGAQQAVGILHRREIAADADPEHARAHLAARYADEHLDVAAATAGGFVDEIVAPGATRARISAALEALDAVHRPPRPTRNIPL
ncbi:MAG TPA: acyl-CoA carboxylase subunit beta [Solirubrobacteraceae bacterium]|nr:acyl-CoA carboxylase subunit beta [Solirubrobacteraceae bacterium]